MKSAAKSASAASAVHGVSPGRVSMAFGNDCETAGHAAISTSRTDSSRRAKHGIEILPRVLSRKKLPKFHFFVNPSTSSTRNGFPAAMTLLFRYSLFDQQIFPSAFSIAVCIGVGSSFPRASAFFVSS